LKTKPMAMVSTPIQTAQSMRDNGRKTNKTEKVSNHGLMAPLMKASINKEKNLASENSSGLMAQSMKDSLLIITSMEKVKFHKIKIFI
jgi:hypothetical protein